jgi:hypothetical protein
MTRGKGLKAITGLREQRIFSHKDYTGREIRGCHPQQSRFTGCVFDNALIHDVDFEGSNLDYATFRGSVLSGVDFSRCSLQNVKWSGALIGPLFDAYDYNFYEIEDYKQNYGFHNDIYCWGSYTRLKAGTWTLAVRNISHCHEALLFLDPEEKKIQHVQAGCFSGTPKEFMKGVRKTFGARSRKAVAYREALKWAESLKNPGW